MTDADRDKRRTATLSNQIRAAALSPRRC